MKFLIYFLLASCCLQNGMCRDEDKIMKSCYWPNEVFEPCFGGCAEVSCDNPRNHLRPCYPYCEAGCICEDPYVRDDRTHQCVLPRDCSPTQMGIPVPPRGTDKSSQAPEKHELRNPRIHERDNPALDLEDSLTAGNHMENMKKPPELSRMGNYFNIVIAPPPIKALHPRKQLQEDPFRHSGN